MPSFEYMIYIIYIVYHTHNIGKYFYPSFFIKILYKNYIIYFMITQLLGSVKNVSVVRQLVNPDIDDRSHYGGVAVIAIANLIILFTDCSQAALDHTRNRIKDIKLRCFLPLWHTHNNMDRSCG